MVELEDIYVAGVGMYLPQAMPAAEAVERGLVDERTAQRTGMKSVCVSTESGPEMAVRAARQALGQAGAGPDDIDLVLHACTYFQGHDLWAPASYVQRESVGNACMSLVVDQLSNGGMAAMELAVAYLEADATRRGALLTTGDRFCLPGMDRWRTDPGTVLGDGGTALVLSRSGGFARVTSMVTVSDPSLEKMGRGVDAFAAAPLQARAPITLDDHRARLISELGMSELIDRLLTGQRAALDQALDDANIKANDIDWFVVPHLGHPKMAFQFFTPLEIDPALSTWPFGSGVGHLGAGDQFAGLAHLVRSGVLAPGQSVVLVSAGGGFAWTVAVLEILTAP
ncbi:MAG: hypothetical protein JWQ39_2039 [Glaciihabitans sp.]|nr:hypothetical protein [Glaciihabitans sp.]